MIVKMLVTKLRESKALRINKNIRPREIAADIKIFFKTILKENVNAKYNGIKKADNWLISAWLKVSG